MSSGHGEDPECDSFCVIRGGGGIEMGCENPVGFNVDRSKTSVPI